METPHLLSRIYQWKCSPEGINHMSCSTTSGFLVRKPVLFSLVSTLQILSLHFRSNTFKHETLKVAQTEGSPFGIDEEYQQKGPIGLRRYTKKNLCSFR